MKSRPTLIQGFATPAGAFLCTLLLSTTPACSHGDDDLGIAVTVAALTIVPVDGTAPVLTPVTINAGPGDQNDPHVSGNWAAYASDNSIRTYQFSTAVDAQIPTGPSARDFLSDISGSKVVFSRIVSGLGTSVMVFDAAIPAAAPIEIDPAPGTNRLGSAIGGNTVACIDFGLDPNGELIIHDLTTSTSLRITNDTTPDQTPSVSPDGSNVTWEHCDSGLSNCDIWQAVKSGAEWNVGVVSDSADPEYNPDTNGTLVVYASSRGGTSDLFWRPVVGGAEVQLQLPGLETSPSIAGNFIAFESRPSPSANFEIYVYDITANRRYQITNTPTVNKALNDITLLGNGAVRVVWTSNEDGNTARNVRAATFDLHSPPTLSYPTDAGYFLDGVSPDFGSSSTSFAYKVVFTDIDNQAPSILNVCIDGLCRAMNPDTAASASLRDGDYRNGEQYSYATTLLVSAHRYFFEASDGRYPARVPSLGLANGPSVSNLTMANTFLPNAKAGVAYKLVLTATGGVLPYVWSASAVPPGLVFDALLEVIQGIPNAPGVYPVTISVTDAAGGADAKTLTLTVDPGGVPVLMVPSGTVYAAATSPAGATVTYVVTATDAVDPNPVVTCAPPSGSVFPIGPTVVVCTATNAFGGSTTAGFRVVVKAASEQIADLKNVVKSFKLKRGLEHRLLADLDDILAALAGDGPELRAACRDLRSFVADVREGLGRGLIVQQARQLVGLANQIGAALGCLSAG